MSWMRPVGRRLLARSYYATKCYRLLREKLRLRGLGDAAPILVYTMGKVGSSSLHDVIGGCTDRPVHHVHFLAPSTLREQDAIYRRRFRESATVHPHFLTSLCLRRRLDGPPRGPRWTVVTLTRDPLARNLSAFFQTLAFWHPDLAARLRDGRPVDPVETLHAFEREGWNEDPFRWFDAELRTVFGVDVFSRPFPRERGWELFQSERAEVLVVRLEDLDRCLPDALRAVGLTAARVSTANVGATKFYADAYRDLVARIELPSEVLDRLYESPRTAHFYGPEERARMRARFRVRSLERGARE